MSMGSGWTFISDAYPKRSVSIEEKDPHPLPHTPDVTLDTRDVIFIPGM
ncbi:MAG TPA: hypothetical protein VF115_15190 [Acidimicrobiia bacterium]